MTRDTLDFLKRLLDTPGPSGFETAPARVWREEVKAFADQVTADVHGNSVAVVNPEGRPRLMLAGHIDEIGLQLTHVDDEGYLYFAGIGGWDSQVLVGQRVVIAGSKGSVRGVIGKQAVHLMKREDLDKVSKITDLWIDIGAANKAEALERVRVGGRGSAHERSGDRPGRRPGGRCHTRDGLARRREEARGGAQARGRAGAGARLSGESGRLRAARGVRRAREDSVQHSGRATRYRHRRGRDL